MLPEFSSTAYQIEAAPRLRVAEKGFALVVTLIMMVLLAILSIGLLSLSSISLRQMESNGAIAEAHANARLALMIAIGELQKEMGPDMRVSAESAILDTDEETDEIDGVAQSHWLGSYDSWGNWLNASYTRPSGGSPLTIQSTYAKGRSTMFRRWLLSMPPGSENIITAPTSLTGWDNSNSVVMVGKGSLGIDPDKPKLGDELDKVTRAYLAKVGTNGRHAWWISPENHKAKICLAARTRNLNPDEWAVAQGTTAQVGAGVMDGLGVIDPGTPATDLMLSKVITLQTLSVPATGIDPDDAKRHFFDLSDSSKGVIASVKTGGLKKDLSLLLDRNNADLPAPYKFVPANNVEPSIRPLSTDILAEGAVLPKRPFASWPAMRSYYRMYRQDSDLKLTGNAGYHTGSPGSLSWDGQTPYTRVLAPRNFGNTRTNWTGENAYMRMPLIAKLTFLHSIKTTPNLRLPGQSRCLNLFSPVITLWNPYNTEMRFPSGVIGVPAAINHTWPTKGYYYINGVRTNWADQTGLLGNDQVYFNSDTGSDIILGPGEFKVFSHRSIYTDNNADQQLYPGFDPTAIGGTISPEATARSFLTTDIIAERVGTRLEFDSYYGWNRQNGHSPGSLSAGLIYGNQFYQYMPNLYQIDWFKDRHNQTSITSETVFYSTSPEPILVGYTQLSLKCLGQSEYESINWEQDWRVRNWIQAPPFYFGSGLYMSENNATAHTQRLDSPYAVSLGPISALELPKVVGQVGERAFLGSGTNPYEKVTAVPAIELPTAPISNLAGFSGMRMSPGWNWCEDLNPDVWMRRGPRDTDKMMSLVSSNSKRVAYQSGITGPGIGNSFMHPMIPRTGIYQFHNNSISQDHQQTQTSPIVVSNTKAYSDYWDHVFVLNDALWDDYYISTLANQTRPGAPSALSLSQNLDKLVSNQPIANTRYQYYSTGLDPADIKQDLLAQEGYLKSASHLMVDGSFNVNSTSVAAWYALFAGIRERQIYYRTQNGSLAKVEIPSDARIALSRFETPNSDQEVTNIASGVTRDDGNQSWTGVRFLTDAHLELLAQKCVEQVKKRGPFLNFSEFINRRLSNDELGVMGALQSAIDYDDNAPNRVNLRSE